MIFNIPCSIPTSSSCTNISSNLLSPVAIAWRSNLQSASQLENKQ